MSVTSKPPVKTAADWAELRELFPVMKQVTYLRNCAASPISTRVSNAMRAYLDDYLERGKYKDVDLAEVAREKAGRLIGASADEIAFVTNTVSGINIVAEGISWREGDNIVVNDTIEFPANYYPWLNQRSKGVHIKAVPETGGRIRAEDVIAAIDDRTRLVAISWVQFTTGYRCDLDAIGKVCRERGIYFSVDAVQGVGAFPINVGASYVDFLQAGAHKWMYGPMGIGIFYCRKELLEDLRVSNIGHKSMTYDDLPYKWDLVPTAARFEPGVSNYAGIFGLNAALDLLFEIGIDAIAQREIELCDLLIARLREKGCEIVTPLGPNERSGIVLFKSPQISADELVAKAEHQRIMLNVRLGGTRVGPGFYNNENDFDRLLNLVP